MRLTKVSVQKYRSIDQQAQFNVGDFTVLVGPNNQGKSNLLRAAVLAMEVVEAWATAQPAGRAQGQLPTRFFSRQRFRFSGRQAARFGDAVGYDWDRDYPLFARDRRGAQRSTVVNLEFELDEQEQVDFKALTMIATNQRLPIRVTLNEESVSLAVPKQGKGQHGERAREIAGFISDRVALLHVPAVRPGAIALSIAEEILQSRRRALARTPEYREALEQVRQLDQAAVDDVQQLLFGTLRRFVPGTESISLQVRGLERSGGLEDIHIDDGVNTSISAKGDGIQSLVALALTLEWTNSTSHPDKQLIVAVEEPESHLHPGAIHELRDVLRGIAGSQQVIVTTHSQALINRSDLARNVIVSDRTAKPATSLSALREALGVRLSDALTAADVVVVCEGNHDTSLLPLLLSKWEPRIANWIADGRLMFESAGSGSKVHARVLAARSILVEPIVVLDSDPAGERDVQKLIADGYIDQTRIVQIRRASTRASELEDIFTLDAYLQAVEKIVGFSFSQRQRGILDRGHAKAWSDRLEDILTTAGVPDAKALVVASKTALQQAVRDKLSAGEPVVRPDCEDLLARLAELIRGSMRSV
ncbi:AAA family ATPase [Mumia sp. ZJ430]|uniref:ATP-dependent nuclease n=1 Tax=Mumia sp. ZJ430 TaxID=2708083 RepID=UPI0014245329|nr:AAA family ATPase [Mumia sp. ZJ430]